MLKLYSWCGEVLFTKVEKEELGLAEKYNEMQKIRAEGDTSVFNPVITVSVKVCKKIYVPDKHPLDPGVYK